MTHQKPGLLAVGCVAAWAAAVTVTVTGAGPHPVALGVLQGVVVGVPLVVGYWRGRNAHESPFARLLLLAGVGLAVVALSASPSAVPYSVGRVAGWLVEPGLVYLVLAFPHGRLTGRLDRRLVVAVLVLVGVLYLPTIPLTTRFPEPFPWSECAGGCPGNAFAVVAHEPAFVGDVVVPVRDLLAATLLFAVTGALAARAARGRPLQRVTLVPVVAAAMLHAPVLACYLLLRRFDPRAPELEYVGYVYLLSLPAVALAFAGGQVVRVARAARALEQLAHALRSGARVGDVEAALSQVLEDPSLRVLHGAPGGTAWVDESGHPVRLPAPSSDLAVTQVADGRAPVAVVHDPVLDPTLVRAAAEIALLRLENDRLVGRLRRSLAELDASRARLVGAADRERRQIERRLHDGAQQGLVALRIRLSLLHDRLEEQAPAEAEAVDELGALVEEAIEQVRALAKGVYPPVLAHDGVAAALRSTVRATDVPVIVDDQTPRRYSPDLETAVFFTCSEAIQNALKHAAGATAVTVRLRERTGELSFEVHDDGAGFEPRATPGSGLTNMRDRIAAVGGRLEVYSVAGGGTRLTGRIPVGAEAGAVSDAPGGAAASPRCSRRPGTSAPPSPAG
jgi:signal transduction histidine kinase